MANTLKDLASSVKIVGQVALEQSLTELKTYIDAQISASGSSASARIAQVQNNLDTLIGAQGGDLDKVINTFNEIKAFLADYDEDDTLKSLLDAVQTAATSAASAAEGNAKTYADGLVNTERTRAQGIEGGLNTRITTLENVSIMTAAEATAIYNGIFNPTQGGGE